MAEPIHTLLYIIKNSESNCRARIFYYTGLGHHIYQKKWARLRKSGTIYSRLRQKKFVKLNYLFRINFLHFTILLPPLPTYILEGKKLVKFNFMNFFCLLGRLVPDYLGEFFLLQRRWAQTGRYIFMGKLTQEHMYLGPFLYLKVIVHIYIECGIFYIRSVQNSKIIWFFVLCVYLLICFGAENQNYFFS